MKQKSSQRKTAQPLAPPSTINPGDFVGKVHNDGWLGEVERIEGDWAWVWWQYESGPSMVLLSDLKLKPVKWSGAIPKKERRKLSRRQTEL